MSRQQQAAITSLIGIYNWLLKKPKMTTSMMRPSISSPQKKLRPNDKKIINIGREIEQLQNK